MLWQLFAMFNQQIYTNPNSLHNYTIMHLLPKKFSIYVSNLFHSKPTLLPVGSSIPECPAGQLLFLPAIEGWWPWLPQRQETPLISTQRVYFQYLPDHCILNLTWQEKLKCTNFCVIVFHVAYILISNSLKNRLNHLNKIFPQKRFLLWSLFPPSRRAVAVWLCCSSDRVSPCLH